MKPWSERDKAVVWHPFTQQREWCASEPLVIAGAEGAFLVDDRGRRYLDGVGSLWCNLHGHNHPRLNQAIAEQLAAVAHTTFLGLTHRPGIELAERLTELTGLDRVFYSDSGSSAVEIALKLAFQLGQLSGRTTRNRFLHLSQSYHGDTLGAVGVGGIEVFHRVFGAIVVPGIAVPTPYTPAAEGMSAEAQLERGLAALDRVLDHHAASIAAFVVEPLIQGAAGMLTQPPGYLRAVADRCRALEIPLIVDEVATGFGRTGTLFACEQEGVTPDFLCLGKGISGGYLPLAATLTTESVYSAFLGERSDLKHFFHGHTYTANPLACAAGLASLALLLDPASPDRVSPDRESDPGLGPPSRESADPGPPNRGSDGEHSTGAAAGLRLGDTGSSGPERGAPGPSAARLGDTGSSGSEKGARGASGARSGDTGSSASVPGVSGLRLGDTRSSGPRGASVPGVSGLRLGDTRSEGDSRSERPRIKADYAALGGRLQAALDRHVRERKGVVEIRRIGAMVGIELGPYPWERFVGAEVCERARAHGVILRPLGDVVVWMPPLSVTDPEIELLASATAAAIEETCST